MISLPQPPQCWDYKHAAEIQAEKEAYLPDGARGSRAWCLLQFSSGEDLIAKSRWQ
jgi:hypothetical protein